MNCNKIIHNINRIIVKHGFDSTLIPILEKKINDNFFNYTVICKDIYDDKYVHGFQFLHDEAIENIIGYLSLEEVKLKP